MTYVTATPMLDYNQPQIQALIAEKKWATLSVKEQISHVYNYVRDEIQFGYNEDDAMTASQVLQDGYGQCNTKGILLMALLRGLGISCRLHGFLIDKKMQKGAIKGLFYRLAPNEILHSWVEVYYKEEWLNLEGFILDRTYLCQLQKKFASAGEVFFGFGVATDNFQNPAIDWKENDTYIQKEGITRDLGIFAQPDDFFAQHGQSLSKGQKVVYRKFVRHLMNRNVAKIRQKGG